MITAFTLEALKDKGEWVEVAPDSLHPTYKVRYDGVDMFVKEFKDTAVDAVKIRQLSVARWAAVRFGLNQVPPAFMLGLHREAPMVTLNHTMVTRWLDLRPVVDLGDIWAQGPDNVNRLLLFEWLCGGSDAVLNNYSTTTSGQAIPHDFELYFDNNPFNDAPLHDSPLAGLAIDRVIPRRLLLDVYLNWSCITKQLHRNNLSSKWTTVRFDALRQWLLDSNDKFMPGGELLRLSKETAR